MAENQKITLVRSVSAILLLTVVACSNDGEPGSAAQTTCDPLPVPAAATGIVGRQADGSYLGHNGRGAGGVGTSIILDGVAQGVVTHPSKPLAFVSAYGDDGRRLLVVNLETQQIVQNLASGQPHGKAVLSVDGRRLFVPQGTEGNVMVYDVGDDGMLAPEASVDVGTRVVALHAAADGHTLWAAKFTERELVAIDIAALQVRKRIPLTQGAWDIVELQGRSELYISDLNGERIAVVDTKTETVVASIDVPTSPARMTRKPDDSVVWVAVSGRDYVVAIDTGTRSVTRRGLVAESDLVDDSGERLPNSNPNSVAYDALTNRLFVTRGSDNAVTVFDADSLQPLGSLPTSWWPTDLNLPATLPGRLLVAEGFGGGLDPQPDDLGERSNINNGTLTLVDLSTLDLSKSTKMVEANQIRSADRYPFDCPSGKFPIPTRAGQTSPIKHVVLLIKENKKFDTYFGDAAIPGADADPNLVRWSADITPNHRKLARDFNISDRFFVESQESDSGHLFLSAAHVTEFTQRFFSEPSGSLGDVWPLRNPAIPDAGNLHTHLLDHGRSIAVYGEIVGMTIPNRVGMMPAAFSDPSYPGGPIINYATHDRDRAAYVVAKTKDHGLPDFTLMLLPNDHTQGTDPGKPTPESYVADNDEGLGILIDGLSHNEALWKETAIFVLEDDPQGSGDHVSEARSFLIVVSPWARRGYVSHHQTSFLSVHATILRILGVPPLGREDAGAAPLWDLFTAEPDFTPWTRLPRTYPEETNPPDAFAASISARMDFRSADRNPELGKMLDLYRQWKLGLLSREQAERKLVEPMQDEEYKALLEEAVEESTAFDSAFRDYNIWLAEQDKECLPDGRVVPLQR
ncbi:MAG: bifunctional YncE family protein/alkaline phosphatase family protein [Deltaproteobacteria bacterium]|nr:bifunctional YncE family protein/alkaline phosphatase family protein [Deltaproteobacteria bacterium]